MNTQVRRLKRAILYLKYKETIKSDAEIAAATNISAASLSGYLSGTKVIPEDWITTFETVYELKLEDPLTYFDFEWFGILNIKGKDVDCMTFLQLYLDMKKVLDSKEKIIEGIRTTLTYIAEERDKLREILHRVDDKLVDTFIIPPLEDEDDKKKEG